MAYSIKAYHYLQLKTEGAIEEALPLCAIRVLTQNLNFGLAPGGATLSDTVFISICNVYVTAIHQK